MNIKRPVSLFFGSETISGTQNKNRILQKMPYCPNTGNYKGFRSYVPGTVDRDKYIFLLINHSITEQELALNYCLRAAVVKAWGAES